MLTQGLPELRARVRFFRLPVFKILESGKLSEEGLLVSKFLQVLHPLAATTIFESQASAADGQPFRVSYLYIKSGDDETQPNQYVWLRHSDRFGKSLSALLESLYATKGLLIDETSYTSLIS